MAHQVYRGAYVLYAFDKIIAPSPKSTAHAELGQMLAKPNQAPMSLSLHQLVQCSRMTVTSLSTLQSYCQAPLFFSASQNAVIRNVAYLSGRVQECNAVAGMADRGAGQGPIRTKHIRLLAERHQVDRLHSTTPCIRSWPGHVNDILS